MTTGLQPAPLLLTVYRPIFVIWHRHKDSNPDDVLRRHMSYPLNDVGISGRWSGTCTHGFTGLRPVPLAALASTYFFWREALLPPQTLSCTTLSRRVPGLPEFTSHMLTIWRGIRDSNPWSSP